MRVPNIVRTWLPLWQSGLSITAVLERLRVGGYSNGAVLLADIDRLWDLDLPCPYFFEPSIRAEDTSDPAKAIALAARSLELLRSHSQNVSNSGQFLSTAAVCEDPVMYLPSEQVGGRNL